VNDGTTRPVTPSSWNLANYLTVLRLAMVPVFAVLLLAPPAGDSAHNGYRVAAAVVFALAAYTDYVDGQIARRRNLVTSFGELADPIADKALTGAAFIGLSLLGELWWWVTALVIFREVGVTLLRFFVIRHGVMPASRGGKLKTLLQNVALVVYVLPLSGALAAVGVAVMAAAVLVTVVTGVDYVARAATLRTTSERADMKRARKAERTDRA
jgi:CDP-diacylglycerol--glycerol-3-phosphate 3-phosphatidyltransferase